MASLDDVRTGMGQVGYPSHRIHYHQGLVEETVPAQAPDRIAILRLDTDWYESTRHELEHLYPRLSPGGVLVIDDYGHHPTEIAAVLEAARTALGRRLIVAFQPHRYTRTQQLMAEFGPALREADDIVLTDIYAASEEPLPGVTAEALADAIRAGAGKPVRLVKQLDDVVSVLLELANPGDAVITLGAGSIGTLPKRLVEALERRGER
jgi:UDP-N-acetylmuramate-alanine ligase